MEIQDFLKYRVTPFQRNNSKNKLPTSKKKTSSSEPLSQFQPMLAQSILKCLKYVQMKVDARHHGETIAKIDRICNQLLNIIFPRDTGLIFNELGTKHP